MKYILNGWSWNMPIPRDGLVSYHTLSREEFDLMSKDAISIVNHPALANILGIECNRKHIRLEKGDTVLAVYTTGGKLSHEAIRLPEGIGLEFKCVKILEEF